MSDVNRYTAWEIQQDQGGWKPVLEATDEFVRHDDYAALRARLEAVEKDIAATLVRERDANKKAMQHLRKSEQLEIASKNHAAFSHEWRTRAERAEAALATARRDALLEAVEKVESLWAYRTCAEVADAIRAIANEAPE